MRYVTTAEWIGMQKGRQEGRQEGIEEGMKQGVRSGELKVLEQLLLRRFGPLPAWAGERLAAAAEADLERWTDRLLEAESLEDLFAWPGGGGEGAGGACA